MPFPDLAADRPPLFNPGEPVFDQATGEPYVNEDGALVEVEPESKVLATDGRTLDGDDVVNAAFLRANIFEGEVIRDRRRGVPYLRLALGQQDQSLAVGLVVAEVRASTPGVAGVVNVTIDGLDGRTRVLRWRGRFVKQALAGDLESAITTLG